jgi:hypothetical protein
MSWPSCCFSGPRRSRYLHIREQLPRPLLSFQPRLWTSRWPAQRRQRCQFPCDAGQPTYTAAPRSPIRAVRRSTRRLARGQFRRTARCRLRGRRRCAGGRPDRVLLDRRRCAHTAAVSAAQTQPLSIFRRAPKSEPSIQHSSAMCCGINLAKCQFCMAAEMAADKDTAQAQSRHLNRPQDPFHGRHRMSNADAFRSFHD